MLLLASDLRAVLWFAVIPAVLSVTVLVIWVREPPRSEAPRAGGALLKGFAQLPRAYWVVVALGAVLTLARFSEAFLVVRARDLGMALAMVPVVLVVMNVAYAAIAYPAGVAADRGHRRALLLWGLSALIAADLLIASTASFSMLFAGIVLWGAHMGLTQGLLSALVADAAPAALRGTAFGMFHLVSGVALLAASALAGWLWSAFGASWTFYAGAAFTSVALAGLVFRTPPGSGGTAPRRSLRRVFALFARGGTPPSSR
jgi:predicted MFS family arabinose efflux permease